MLQASRRLRRCAVCASEGLGARWDARHLRGVQKHSNRCPDIIKYWKIGMTGGGPVSCLESRHLRFRHGGSAKRVLQLRMLPRVSMQGHCHGYCRSGELIHAAQQRVDGA